MTFATTHVIPVKDKRVSIQVSAPGYIILTAISFMVFIGKVRHAFFGTTDGSLECRLEIAHQEGC